MRSSAEMLVELLDGTLHQVDGLVGMISVLRDLIQSSQLLLNPSRRDTAELSLSGALQAVDVDVRQRINDVIYHVKKG